MSFLPASTERHFLCLGTHWWHPLSVIGKTFLTPTDNCCQNGKDLTLSLQWQHLVFQGPSVTAGHADDMTSVNMWTLTSIRSRGRFRWWISFLIWVIYTLDVGWGAEYWRRLAPLPIDTVIGSSCKSSLQCLLFVPHSHCEWESRTCTCQSYHVQVNSTQCVPASLLGFGCSIDAQCTLKVSYLKQSRKWINSLQLLWLLFFFFSRHNRCQTVHVSMVSVNVMMDLSPTDGTSVYHPQR